jgi:hypothetical protein
MAFCSKTAAMCVLSSLLCWVAPAADRRISFGHIFAVSRLYNFPLIVKIAAKGGFNATNAMARLARINRNIGTALLHSDGASK